MRLEDRKARAVPYDDAAVLIKLADGPGKQSLDFWKRAFRARCKRSAFFGRVEAHRSRLRLRLFRPLATTCFGSHDAAREVGEFRNAE
jgi:hypothetical protein